MTIASTRTVRINGDEAVILPPEVAFGADIDVVIIRPGEVMTIYPVSTSIPEMIARLQSMPKPPAIEERDTDPAGP